MTDKEIKEAMEKYMAELKNLNSSIEELQENCPHDEYILKSIVPTKFELRKICENCDKILGMPSQQDLENNGYI